MLHLRQNLSIIITFLACSIPALCGWLLFPFPVPRETLEGVLATWIFLAFAFTIWKIIRFTLFKIRKIKSNSSNEPYLHYFVFILLSIIFLVFIDVLKSHIDQESFYFALISLAAFGIKDAFFENRKYEVAFYSTVLANFSLSTISQISLGQPWNIPTLFYSLAFSFPLGAILITQIVVRENMNTILLSIGDNTPQEAEISSKLIQFRKRRWHILHELSIISGPFILTGLTIYGTLETFYLFTALLIPVCSFVSNRLSLADNASKRVLALKETCIAYVLLPILILTLKLLGL